MLKQLSIFNFAYYDMFDIPSKIDTHFSLDLDLKWNPTILNSKFN